MTSIPTTSHLHQVSRQQTPFVPPTKSQAIQKLHMVSMAQATQIIRY